MQRQSALTSFDVGCTEETEGPDTEEYGGIRRTGAGKCVLIDSMQNVPRIRAANFLRSFLPTRLLLLLMLILVL